MSTTRFVCQQCARTARRPFSLQLRPMITQSSYSTTTNNDSDQNEKKPAPTKDSAMSRRLQEATEEALLTGGRAGRKAVEEAGFSEELKERLFNKIADAEFRAEHSHTMAAAGIDTQTLGSASRTGAGTRDLASAQHWTGDEAPEDTILRMLDDARKPLPPSLRGKPSIPDPVVVDLRLRRPPSHSPGQRAANARDKATVYAGFGMNKSAEEAKKSKDGKAGTESDEKQRAAFRKELRERFGAGAGAANMPNTFTGLAALANERIEDAIARGQFRDIPRGTNVERDARADNPFIDTTEYIMNKMIQRQEIVPPWIEKQQELVRSARSFRMQLRTDWRRHAARSLASRGGSLQKQMEAAERYAAAEQVHNPRRRDVDKMAVATNHTDDPVMAAKVAEAAPAAEAAAAEQSEEKTTASPPGPSPDGAGPAVGDLTRPLRDPAWEAAERSYMELAIRNLNTLTRSYNLMAPELAKKPYFSLDRELLACFADVAPTLAQTIKERAAIPPKPNPDDMNEALGRRVLEKFVGEGGTTSARVYDNKKPYYGLKEMWRDMWKKEDTV